MLSILAALTSLAFDPHVRRHVPEWAAILQLFSVGLLPVVFCLLFSMTVVCWHRYSINFILVAELCVRFVDVG